MDKKVFFGIVAVAGFLVLVVGYLVFQLVGLLMPDQQADRGNSEQSQTETGADSSGEAGVPNNDNQPTNQQQAPGPTTTPVREQTNLSFTLGNQERIQYTSEFINVPDGHISYIREDGELRVWLPINVTSYLFIGSNFDDLSPHAYGDDGYAAPVLWPTDDFFENGYASFGSVLPGREENELLGFYHTESWENFEKRFAFTGSIAAVVSYDKGETWERKGQVVTGKNALPPGQRISGAGQPSVIRVGEYLYMYYIDWNAIDPDAIHLARAPFSSGGVPGSWQKWTTEGFGPPGIDGTSDPVILPPNSGADVEFAGIPSVSYNTYLETYVCVFEANTGFYITTSDDGITWKGAQLVYRFPTRQVDKQPGDTWYSYPTLLSPSEDVHTKTGKEGYIYYSEGQWQQVLHYMVRRKIVLDK